MLITITSFISKKLSEAKKGACFTKSYFCRVFKEDISTFDSKIPSSLFVTSIQINKSLVLNLSSKFENEVFTKSHKIWSKNGSFVENGEVYTEFEKNVYLKNILWIYLSRIIHKYYLITLVWQNHALFLWKENWIQIWHSYTNMIKLLKITFRKIS